MTTATRGRKTARRTAVFALALLLLAVLAPVANAQVGDVVDSVTDAVGNSSNDSDSGSGAAPSIGDIVGDATAGDGEGEGEGEGDGNDPTKIIEDTIEDATSGAEEAENAVGSEADNTTGGTVDNVEQSTGRDLRGSLDPVTPGEGGHKTRSGSRSHRNSGHVGVGSSYGDSYSQIRSGLAGLHRDRAGRKLHLTTTADGDGGIAATIEQLAEAAVESAKKLAFPLALTVMVVGFLMVQGRVDRKDPKLALAPVTVEHDLLSFQ